MKTLGTASIYGFEGTQSWPTALFQRLKRRVRTQCDNNGWTAGDTSRLKQQPVTRHASAFQTAHRGRQKRIRTNQELTIYYKIPKLQYILKGLEPLKHMNRIDQTTAPVFKQNVWKRGRGERSIKKVGRPRMRQLEDADNDPREGKVKTWTRRQTTNVHLRLTVGQDSWGAAQLECINQQYWRKSETLPSTMLLTRSETNSCSTSHEIPPSWGTRRLLVAFTRTRLPRYWLSNCRLRKFMQLRSETLFLQPTLRFPCYYHHCE
jgi:hypothetical protein